jgi:hypothetical protein
MTFIFNLVEYTCFDSQGADKVLNALNKAAQYQIDNSITGVLTYHFSRPSMEEPEKLRFIEFYTSEKAFWEHGMDPMVSKELMSTFDPNIRKSFVWWALYSNDIETKVKETVAILKGIEVSPVQKHVHLNYKSRFILEPVLFVGKLSKKQNNLKIFLEQSEGSFSESAIYQFFFNDPIGNFHIISLWPSQEDIINSLIQLDLPEVELRSQIYLGKENPTNRLKKIFKPWNPKFLIKPEAGYCFHPKYR